MSVDGGVAATVAVTPLWRLPAASARAAGALLRAQWPEHAGRAQDLAAAPGPTGLPVSFVAEAPGAGVVGHARLVPAADDARAAVLEDVVVAGAWRGRGVGRALVAAGEAHAAQFALERVHLAAGAAAAPFYARLGYAPGPAVQPVRPASGGVEAISRFRQPAGFGGPARSPSEEPAAGGAASLYFSRGPLQWLQKVLGSGPPG
jgi:GNAT superfamily N-acetyltransferase